MPLVRHTLRNLTDPISKATLIGVFFLLISFSGCSMTPDTYVEQHAINHLTVVFLDEQSLWKRWETLTGQDAIQIMPSHDTTPIVKTLQGFFDGTTNTIYCEKWHFEACGHELHHAALGEFHPRH